MKQYGLPPEGAGSLDPTMCEFCESPREGPDLDLPDHVGYHWAVRSKGGGDGHEGSTYHCALPAMCTRFLDAQCSLQTG